MNWYIVTLGPWKDTLLEYRGEGRFTHWSPTPFGAVGTTGVLPESTSVRPIRGDENRAAIILEAAIVRAAACSGLIGVSVTGR